MADGKMWPTVFKIIGGSLLTFALVWVLVLGWWQSNDYEPSKLELGLYLAALPLALVGGFLLLRGFIDHLKAQPEPASTKEAVRDEDPLALASAQTAAVERAFTIGLIDSYLLTAGGASADDMLSAIESGKRPEPLSRLVDEHGFPVFAAEVAELDVDATLERLADTTGLVGQFAGHVQCVRSLALLEQILEASQDRVRDLLEQAKPAIRLRVLWVIPAAWATLDGAALKNWLLSCLGAGLEKFHPDISVLPAANEVNGLRILDDISLHTNRDRSCRELTLLLGTVSAVDDESVEQRANAGNLFTPDHQQRQVPGEGAVALLLTGEAVVRELNPDGAIAVSRLSAALRDKPVDSGGRVTGKLIDQLSCGLFDVTGVEHAAIKTVVLDTDHRASHLTEALEGLGQGLEHLDPIKDCLATGSVTGDISPIGALVALACAQVKVRATEAPALCISNQHAVDRGVILAMPMPEQREIQNTNT